jgi:hypothetical protein
MRSEEQKQHVLSFLSLFTIDAVCNRELPVFPVYSRLKNGISNELLQKGELLVM